MKDNNQSVNGTGIEQTQSLAKSLNGSYVWLSGTNNELLFFFKHNTVSLLFRTAANTHVPSYILVECGLSAHQSKVCVEESHNSIKHLLPSLTKPDTLCACATGLIGATWLTFYQSVTRKKKKLTSFQCFRPTSSDCDISCQNGNQFIIFFL